MRERTRKEFAASPGIRTHPIGRGGAGLREQLPVLDRHHAHQRVLLHQTVISHKKVTIRDTTAVRSTRSNEGWLAR